jgi:hypothetical protein
MKSSFQRRYLNVKDAAFPLVASSSTSTPSAVSTATEPKEDLAVLLFAAEEAERTLIQLSKHQDYYQSKRHETSIRHGEDDRIVQKELVEASEKLLLVSNATMKLKDLVHQKRPTDANHISTLHRAFLVLTTRFLDCMQILSNSNENTHSSSSGTEILMDQALILTRRAHELGFPFHLPLYQRLMESVVTTHSKTSKIPDTIFEIASFTDTLGGTSVVDSELFRPAILALIDDQNFPQVIHVMKAMKNQHDIQIFEPQSTFDIFTSIFETVRQCLTNREFPSLLFMADVREIVQMLEPSLFKLEEEAQKIANKAGDNFRKELEKCVDDLDDDAAENLLSQIDEEDQESMEEYDDDDSAAASDDESSTPPLDSDDYFVLSALTKGIVGIKSRKLFLDMVKYGRLVTKKKTASLESIPPRFVYLPRKQASEQDNKLSDLSEDEGEIDEDVDGDGEIEEEMIEADQRKLEKCIVDENEYESEPDDYERLDAQSLSLQATKLKNEKLLLPDITEQILSLNNGRKLQFTMRFKNVIWNREAEEDDTGIDYSPLAGYRPYSFEDDINDDDSSDSDCD